MQPLRAALLVGKDRPLLETLGWTVSDSGFGLEVHRFVCERRGIGARTLARLFACSPHLVVAEASCPGCVPASIYRSLAPHSRLVLCGTRPPPHLGSLGPKILTRADCILADSEEAILPAHPHGEAPLMSVILPLPADIGRFLESPVERSGAAAFRFLYAGDLSPESGAADLLICLAAWAEQHPARVTEIWWAAQGDLSGVLQAQPLPDNLIQRFLGDLDRQALADCCARCGILVLPPLAPTCALVAEALAAGLVVLAGNRSNLIRRLSCEGLGCWSFDAMRPDMMLNTLAQLLGSREVELNRSRMHGRALVCREHSQTLPERIREAVAAMLPVGRAPAPARLGCTWR
jgi:glycosyltransferase involved in cell wall biosynthesis